MAKAYRNGYQIDDLKQAIDAVIAQEPALKVDLAWSKHIGAIPPTVDYTVSGPAMPPIQSNQPLAVTLVPVTIANNIRAVLGNPTNAHIVGLINNVQTCPVT